MKVSSSCLVFLSSFWRGQDG
uniref:Uncharacterized protein n=1 Tax=Rhizophora mucronata TaxID=61149 RepID=A0A2P2QV08_RHIMU